MVALENISFTIKDKVLLHPLSANFETGKIHLVLGPNGAGKSTFIKLLSGELKPSSGNACFAGRNIRNIRPGEMARFRAVLSQNIELAFPLTVAEVVMMGRLPHYSGKPSVSDEDACREAMLFFDVLDMRERNYLTLSGGEKQRVQFARVFVQLWHPVANHPRYLLLDEPLTYLDIYYQYDLMQKIRQFIGKHNDLTVIGVVHDLNIAATFADTVMLLNNARVVIHDNPEKVLTEKNIREVFRMSVQPRLDIGWPGQ